MRIDDIQAGLPSLDTMAMDSEKIRDAMQRLRVATWAMPGGEQVFPKIDFTASDFNDLVGNRCFQRFMTDIRRHVYEARVIENVDTPLPLIMAFAIFDDIEREMFPQEDESQPEPFSPQEES